jgi:hypothetical protein
MTEEPDRSRGRASEKALRARARSDVPRRLGEALEPGDAALGELTAGHAPERARG